MLTLGDAAHARRLLLRDVAEGLSPYGGLGVGLGELPGRLFCVNGGVVDVLLDVDARDPTGVGALRVVEACERKSSPRCFAVAAGSAGWWRCSPWWFHVERPSAAGEQHEAGATHCGCPRQKFPNNDRFVGVNPCRDLRQECPSVLLPLASEPAFFRRSERPIRDLDYHQSTNQRPPGWSSSPSVFASCFGANFWLYSESTQTTLAQQLERPTVSVA